MTGLEEIEMKLEHWCAVHPARAFEHFARDIGRGLSVQSFPTHEHRL
jgi:hypothetical protein